MNYLHYEYDAGAEDVIEVELTRRANVRLLDDENYALYEAGKLHRYIGGSVNAGSVDLRPPRQGHWHVVIDLGGYAGTVDASVRKLTGQAAEA